MGAAKIQWNKKFNRRDRRVRGGKIKNNFCIFSHTALDISSVFSLRSQRPPRCKKHQKKKRRLILARTAGLRPDLRKGFHLVKEFTTPDTRMIYKD
jgi:hypothetical protein